MQEVKKIKCPQVYEKQFEVKFDTENKNSLLKDLWEDINNWVKSSLMSNDTFEILRINFSLNDEAEPNIYSARIRYYKIVEIENTLKFESHDSNKNTTIYSVNI